MANPSVDSPARGRLARWRPRIAWALTAVVVMPWCLISLDNADGAGMMAHLQSCFRDLDLLYDDDYAAFRMLPAFAYVSSQGVVSNHWPIGATFVQAPGYLAGRLAGWALDRPGATLPLLGVRTWAMLILCGCAWGIRRWIGGRAGGVAALAFVIGTPALYYAAEAPTRPHLFGAAAVLALVWLWQAGRDDSGLARVLAIAALGGLATAIRPQLAPLYLLAAEVAWRDAPSRGARPTRLAAAAAAFVAWPLLVVSLHLWMYGGDAFAGSRGQVTHHLEHFLSSPFHGVLPWSPVVVVGVVGLALGAARGHRGAVLLLGLFLMQVWIDAGSRPVYPGHALGSRSWSGGTAFGPRKLLDAMPLLLPAAMWLREWAGRSAWRAWAIVVATGACLVPSAMLFVAAFLDLRVTQAVLDWPAYGKALATAFDARAWTQALDRRALPLSVTLGVGAAAIAAAALSGAGARIVVKSRRPPRALAATLIGCAVAAHGWLALLQVRTDTLLANDPSRMERAAQRMWGPHLRTLEQARAYDATLRARLGPGAAPP